MTSHMDYAPRKYIDLILEASGKWAKWEPAANKIEPGDYGTVDKETGNFLYCGNIYQNAEATAQIQDLASAQTFRPQVSEPMNELIITSESTKRVEGAFGGNANVPGLVTASLKVQFAFPGGARGAFMVLYKPAARFLPKQVLLDELWDLPSLRGMALVTEVVECPAYSMGLSDEDSEDIGVAFKGSLPVLGVVPGASAGVQAEVGWWASTKAGLYEDGCDTPQGRPVFAPLYSLKEMRPSRKRRWWWTWSRCWDRGDREGGNRWVDVQRPWSALNKWGGETGRPHMNKAQSLLPSYHMQRTLRSGSASLSDALGK